MGIKGGYGMVEGERGSKLRNEDMDADVEDNHPIVSKRPRIGKRLT